MLSDLPNTQLDEIAGAMRSRRYQRGGTIIRQGERGDRFFLIVRGTAEVLRANHLIPGHSSPRSLAILGPGDYFGEVALLHQAPRNATVRALTNMELLDLTSEDFNRLLSPTWQHYERMAHAIELRDTVSRFPLFSDLSPSERDLLLSRLRDESFKPGQVIIREGERGDRFYMIREGQVQVSKLDEQGRARAAAELGEGDFFGERALLLSAPRDATVTAIGLVRAWSLERRDFDDILRHYLHQDDVLQTVARERFEALESPTTTAPAVGVPSMPSTLVGEG
jgi:CRP-like cAMP-binding protein